MDYGAFSGCVRAQLHGMPRDLPCTKPRLANDRSTQESPVRRSAIFLRGFLPAMGFLAPQKKRVVSESGRILRSYGNAIRAQSSSTCLVVFTLMFFALQSELLRTASSRSGVGTGWICREELRPSRGTSLSLPLLRGLKAACSTPHMYLLWHDRKRDMRVGRHGYFWYDVVVVVVVVV